MEENNKRTGRGKRKRYGNEAKARGQFLSALNDNNVRFEVERVIHYNLYDIYRRVENGTIIFLCTFVHSVMRIEDCIRSNLIYESYKNGNLYISKRVGC